MIQKCNMSLWEEDLPSDTPLFFITDKSPNDLDTANLQFMK